MESVCKSCIDSLGDKLDLFIARIRELEDERIEHHKSTMRRGVEAE
jgi:hypothetical protein